MNTQMIIKGRSWSLAAICCGAVVAHQGFASTYEWVGALPGTWDNSSAIWSVDGGAAQAVNVYFTAQPVELQFNGLGGVIAKDGYSLFASSASSASTPTSLLSFAAGSNYTIQAADGSGDAINYNGATRHSFIKFNVGAGATLSLGGNGNQLGMFSTSDVTAGPGLEFGGTGTINFNSGAFVSAINSQTRITVSDGVNLNFNSGSVVAGPGASIASPTAYSDMTRIALNEGAITVDGGELHVGYRSEAASLAGADGRGFGISVGATTTGAGSTFTLESGTVTALGDPRSAAGNPSFAGIAIGIAAGNTGGTVNLNGGTLYTSNIRAGVASNENAILNLNGSTIIVSTAESGTNGTTPTAAQFQTRLDGFITGFADTATNHVSIGENGITFDTSQIGDNVLEKTASIYSAMRGTGGLVKVGVNALRLQGANTYSGATLVSGGEFILDGSLVSDVTVQAGAVLSGAGQTTGNVFLEAGATFEGEAEFMDGGDLTWAAGATLDLDLSTLVDEGTAFLTIGNLYKSGSGVYELNVTGIDDGKSYTLIAVSGTNDFELSDFTVNLNGSALHLAEIGNSLVLVPEPSMYALMLGVLSAFGLTFRRRS